MYYLVFYKKQKHILIFKNLVVFLFFELITKKINNPRCMLRLKIILVCLFVQMVKTQEFDPLIFLWCWLSEFFIVVFFICWAFSLGCATLAHWSF